MTFDRALNAPIPDLSDAELDIARDLIGSAKRDIRNQARRADLGDVIDRLIPLNHRIDALNLAELDRQRQISRSRIRK